MKNGEHEPCIAVFLSIQWIHIVSYANRHDDFLPKDAAPCEHKEETAIMRIRKFIVLPSALLLTLALALWSGADRLPAVFAAETGAKPGLYLRNGSPHPVHTPNRVTGRTLNVVDYGADPRNNSKDDRPAIQAAIEAAKPGDEVYLPSGVYNLLSTLPHDKTAQLELKSGVNLRGQSESGTVLISSLDRVASSKVIKIYGKNNIKLSNLTITSTFNRSFSSDYSRNNPSYGGPDNGIYIGQSNGAGSHHITVDRVTVEKFRVIGIRISNSHDVVVRNSTIRKATDVGGGGAGYGVAVQGTAKMNLAGKPNDTYFNVIENNRFEGPYLRHAVIIQYYAHNNVIRGNTITDTALSSIDLHGEDEYLNEVYGNKIQGPRVGAAISVGNIGGTPPYDHDASGPGNLIHGNVISGAQMGILVYMGSPDTVIRGNVIKDSRIADGEGILIMNAPGTVIESNEIYNNTGPRFWGIKLSEDPGYRGRGKGVPRNVQIHDNRVYQNTGGVIVESGSYIYMRRNHMRNNSTIDYIDARK